MSVTVYTRPDCVQCEQTKRVLDRRQITYQVVDVRDPMPGDRAANPFPAFGSAGEPERTVADWLRDTHNFTSAPVVHVDYGNHGEWWSGYKIDKLLDIQRV